MPATTSLQPGRGIVAARFGLLCFLIAIAIAITIALVSYVVPAGATVAPVITVPSMVEPLRTDLLALAAGVVPDAPDLNPTTTRSLRRAVQLVVRPAANGDFRSALTNLDQLDADLARAISSSTGTHVSHKRATIIQSASTTVRTDLNALQEPAA
ncbi:hypothetical protein [Subtercola boreus]|nr:hypothetical protein [Subtercola boreus]